MTTSTPLQWRTTLTDRVLGPSLGQHPGMWQRACTGKPPGMFVDLNIAIYVCNHTRVVSKTIVQIF